MLNIWSMRSWESARPLKKVGRGSDSQGRMDQKGKVADIGCENTNAQTS